MNKPIIAVDIDDVLTKGVESLRLQVNDRFNLNLTPEDYILPGEYHHYFDRVWQAKGVADKIDWQILDDQMVQDQSQILVNDGALPVLRKLSQNYKLIVVTARNTSWEPATYPWLEMYFPNVFSGVYFAGFRGTDRTKADECAELGVGWLIEDNLEHAELALARGVRVILFGDYGWQMHQPAVAGVVHCKDWTQVERYFDERAD